MTIAEGEVQVRWLPGLGWSPGAVDLMTVGPMGRIERAVTLPEALMLTAVIDLLCPATSHWYETVSSLPLEPSATEGRP